ncbi:MAG: GNAT family N-acetyltransferase [Nocardioides sp.]
MDPNLAEVDPLDPANEPLLHAMYDVAVAARADRPFEVWAPWPTAYATWTTPRDDMHEVMWSAEADGQVVGMAHLFMGRLDNQHVAETHLFVHPDHRRRGIGSALLKTVTDRSRAAGRTVLMTAPYSPVDGPGPGELFLDARGFELGIAEMQQACDLDESEPGWPTPPETGYRLEPWQDRIPEALVAGYCAMGEAFNSEAPLGELDLEDEVWSPERVAERDERYLATGRHQFGVLAYAADGTCVGTTELFVNQAATWRALQGGTLVVRGHRGHRLGLALKLVNLRAVRATYPDCRLVFTAVAGVNAPMNAVNEVLGFRDVERTLEMQLRL